MLYVPEVYWDYCKPEVLVQERIYGIPISDMKSLRAAGTNIKVLAENGVEIFFTQVFRHNFFHADMHPGNIFVIATDPEKPKYAAVDFGIVGSLLHLDSGWVPAETRIDHLEAAVRTVCEPIFNKPLAEISFSQVLMRLFRLAQRFDVEIQPQMILLHKTLFNIEGLGRELYPQLDLWQTAHPVLKRWMDEQVGPRAMLDDLRENLPQIRQALRHLPVAIRQLAEQASSGSIKLDMESLEIQQIRAELADQRRQRFWLTVAATSVITGALVVTLNGNVWLGVALLALGGLAAVAGRPAGSPGK
jgi:ubiquinone biosynthesis protein